MTTPINDGGPVVQVGPYVDRLIKCSSCAAMVPWVLAHDSMRERSKLPAKQVCQKCHDKEADAMIEQWNK